MTDLNRPLLGEPNAPCRTCGAPLAADQRYCLQCGERRAEARLPFLDILARQVPGAATAETTVTTRKGPIGRLGGLSANAAAVAGVACLLLALGVGVLIGGLGGNDRASAGQAPAQIISIPSSAPAVAPTTAVPGTTETTPQTGSRTSPKSTKKGSSDKGASSSSSSSGSKATNNALKTLDSSKGGDYSKKSQKLPKTLGTGGKAPPVDQSGTKIGDGSSVQSIG